MKRLSAACQDVIEKKIGQDWKVLRTRSLYTFWSKQGAFQTLRSAADIALSLSPSLVLLATTSGFDSIETLGAEAEKINWIATGLKLWRLASSIWISSDTRG